MTTIAPGIEMYCGDSVALMAEWARNGRRTKLLLSDPPYGAGWQAAGQDLIAGDENPYRAAQDFVPPMANLLEDGAVMLLFCRIDLAPIWEAEMRRSGLTVRPWLRWDKLSAFHDAMNIRNEVLLVGYKGTPVALGDDDAPVLPFARVTRREVTSATPTAKPVAMMRYLIERFSAPGDLIIDPFAGLSPIGEAAIAAGRRYLGAELVERRAAKAVERLQAEADYRRAMRAFEAKA